MDRAAIGFTTQDHSGDSLEVIKRVFAPEFRNRLDAIIQFKPLDFETIGHVVDKFVIELEAQLEPKGVTIEVDTVGRRWLARRGYDPRMGARPMARVIQEHIKRQLAEELLFGRLVNGGHVLVSEQNDQLTLEIVEEVEVH
jgi:ATP-dependent Clp protease ATP-binding subunit ClpA